MVVVTRRPGIGLITVLVLVVALLRLASSAAADPGKGTRMGLTRSFNVPADTAMTNPHHTIRSSWNSCHSPQAK